MRIDNLTFRERLLVFGAVATVLLAVLYVGLIEPSLKQQELMRQTVSELNAELDPLREQLAQAENANQAGQDSEMAQTADAIAAVEKDIEALQRRMLGPGEATALLRALLAQQTQLTLLELSTDAAKPAVPTPADPLTEPSEQVEASAKPSAEPFFKHGITLRAAGSYADLTAYLGQLERIAWTVRWESVRLDATHHPRIELTLKLDSISRKPEWSEL